MDYPRGIEPHGKRIRITFQHKGTRYRRYLDKDPTKRRNISEASRKRDDYLTRLKYDLPLDDDDEISYKDNPTFAQMAEMYLQHLKSLSRRYSTIHSYEQCLNQYWMPALHNIHLRHMRFTHVHDVDLTTQWPSAKTRSNAIIPLRGVFKMAIKRTEGFTTNFATLLDKETVEKRPIPAFTQEQRDAILAELLALDQDAHDYFMLAFQMGCRVPGELNAIKWEDYDGRSIHIHKEFVRCRLVNSTKTHYDRKVLLTPEAKSVLENRIRPINGGWVFTQANGNPWLDGDHMNDLWRSAMENAEIPWRRAYNCRHTRATLDLMAGGKPAWLASQLGHTQDQFFKDYGTWISSDSDDVELAAILAGRALKKQAEEQK